VQSSRDLYHYFHFHSRLVVPLHLSRLVPLQKLLSLPMLLLPPVLLPPMLLLLLLLLMLLKICLLSHLLLGLGKKQRASRLGGEVSAPSFADDGARLALRPPPPPH
jgi:hypothetical protein